MMSFIEKPKVYPIPTKKVASDLPNFPIPEGYDGSFDYLKHVVSGEGITLPEFHDRLTFELEIIKSHEGTANYLLIIWDLVRAAREQFDIYVGPGRGSVAGSLVCFLLGITKVNPIEHNLLFELFINPDRNILPDIDIDLEYGSRDILIDYLKEKYGQDNVTHIITYSRAKDENRRVTGYGVHFCGVALSRLPTKCYTSLTKVDDTIVTVYDGCHIEDVGPVKMDLLDSIHLNQIHRICDLIKKKGLSIDINLIPTDNQPTLEAFGAAETKSIFGFESRKMNDYLLEMDIPSFNDLVALNTMYRPDFMQFIDDYINRRAGASEVKYPLPCMEKYLKETYGILLYQEQLMLLLRQIAGFSRADSDMCRKALGKKKEDQLTRYRKQFLEGGINMGHPKETLEAIWDEWCKNGIYYFNKSHAVCYTFFAYQMMYLKVHYPDEFNRVISTDM